MGSSTGKWVLFRSSEELEHFSTPGVSPVHTAEENALDIFSELRSELPAEPMAIHYYGTGCYRDKPRHTMEKWLQMTFPEAVIYVRSDLESAALATARAEDGWIAILGTGSSLARWTKGVLRLTEYHQNDNPDPGSGTAIGNMLLQSYFYNTLPGDLRVELLQAHPEIVALEPGQIQSQHPDRIIAGFAQWVITNGHAHPFLSDMINQALNDFIENSILPNYREIGGDIHFNGGVAWHARSWLETCLRKHSISMGKIVVSPLDGLITYYKEALIYGKGH